jgi:hypothetical protein
MAIKADVVVDGFFHAPTTPPDTADGWTESAFAGLPPPTPTVAGSRYLSTNTERSYRYDYAGSKRIPLDKFQAYYNRADYASLTALLAAILPGERAVVLYPGGIWNEGNVSIPVGISPVFRGMGGQQAAVFANLTVLGASTIGFYDLLLLGSLTGPAVPVQWSLILDNVMLQTSTALSVLGRVVITAQHSSLFASGAGGFIHAGSDCWFRACTFGGDTTGPIFSVLNDPAIANDFEYIFDSCYLSSGAFSTDGAFLFDKPAGGGGNFITIEFNNFHTHRGVTLNGVPLVAIRNMNVFNLSFNAGSMNHRIGGILNVAASASVSNLLVNSISTEPAVGLIVPWVNCLGIVNRLVSAGCSWQGHSGQSAYLFSNPVRGGITGCLNNSVIAPFITIPVGNNLIATGNNLNGAALSSNPLLANVGNA